MLFKIIITWALFIPVAILNGIIRDLVYKPFAGDLLAHQISTVIGVSAFISMVYFLRRNDFKYLPTFRLLTIGAVWVILTVIFEFGFGLYVDNIPLEKLFADYNIFAGRVWGLMLLSELFTPIIVKIISRRVAR